MFIRNYSNEELIAELEARGFTILSGEEADEMNDSIDAGNVLMGLTVAIHTALEQSNDILLNKLLEALIFSATGENIEITFEEENVA
jgi:hypothetical protein